MLSLKRIIGILCLLVAAYGSKLNPYLDLLLLEQCQIGLSEFGDFFMVVPKQRFLLDFVSSVLLRSYYFIYFFIFFYRYFLSIPSMKVIEEQIRRIASVQNNKRNKKK